MTTTETNVTTRTNSIAERVLGFLADNAGFYAAKSIAVGIGANADSARAVLGKMSKAGSVRAKPGPNGSTIYTAAGAVESDPMHPGEARDDSGPTRDPEAPSTEEVVAGHRPAIVASRRRKARAEHVFVLRTGWEDGHEEGLRAALARIPGESRATALIFALGKLPGGPGGATGELADTLRSLISEEEDREVMDFAPVKQAKPKGKKAVVGSLDSTRGSTVVRVRLEPRRNLATVSLNLPGGPKRWPHGTLLVVKEVFLGDGSVGIMLSVGDSEGGAQ